MSTSSTFAAAVASGDSDDDDSQSWGRLAVACAEQIGTRVGPHLGFVYASDRFAGRLKDVTAVLRRITGIADWVGSVGIGVIGGDQELYDRPALTVLAAPLSMDDYRLIPHVREVGDVVAHDAGLTVLHADPRNQQVAEIVARIAEAGGSFVVGGLTASRGAHEQVAGAVGDAVGEGGVSGVWLSPAVGVQVGLSQGCAPIGPARRITSGQENVVFEIDGRAALEVLKEDIGEALAHRLERVAGLIHVAFPVTGSDTGDYLVRNLVGIDPQRGWIAVGEMVEPGRTMRFVRRDRAAAGEDLTRMLGQLRRRMAAPPRAGLYFSCVARGPNLFGPDSQELAILRRELGGFPLVGMFCNGEISNARLYGYTAVLTLFT
jgi:small ligand-binding sensory domain FIST